MIFKIKFKKFRKDFTRFPVRDQIIFAKRLAMMIKAGVPIATALSILKEQTSNKGSALVIGHLFKTVERGRSLASGMVDYKNILANLQSILSTLAKFLEHSSKACKIWLMN